MNRIALLLAYEGTDFFGYQIQPKGRTVQGELERVLKKIHKGESICSHSSGRTDTGVHARSQVAHFDTTLQLKGWQWVKALNSGLPKDIRIREAVVTDSDFHARYSCVQREYRYRILYGGVEDVFRRNVTHYVPYQLDITAMKEAASQLVGTHDFSSFCSADTSIEAKVRTIKVLELQEEGDELIFRIVGNGFLRNMIRIIVGTLLEIGTNKRNASEILQVLNAKNRQAAGKTAPAAGLILWDVKYRNKLFEKLKDH